MSPPSCVNYLEKMSPPQDNKLRIRRSAERQPQHKEKSLVYGDFCFMQRKNN